MSIALVGPPILPYTATVGYSPSVPLGNHNLGFHLSVIVIMIACNREINTLLIAEFTRHR